MTRPRRAAVIALVALVVVDLAFRLVTPHLPVPLVWSSEEAQVKAGHFADVGAGKVDIVVVGSSVVDLGIDPAAIGGGTAYNAAIRGASADVIGLWTEAVVAPRLRPEVVVIGLTSRELSPNDFEQIGATRDFLDAPAVRQLLGTERFVDRAEREVGRVSEIFRYRTVLRRPLLWFQGRERLDSGVLLSPSGWDRSGAHDPYNASAGVRRYLQTVPLRDFTVGDHERERFETVARTLREAGTRVVVLNMPVTDDYISLHPRGQADYDAATDALRRVAEQSGTQFVDAGVWPTQFFADPVHLNGEGARRLSRQVGQELARS